jgi:hypothetical protein
MIIEKYKNWSILDEYSSDKILDFSVPFLLKDYPQKDSKSKCGHR